MSRTIRQETLDILRLCYANDFLKNPLRIWHSINGALYSTSVYRYKCVCIVVFPVSWSKLVCLYNLWFDSRNTNRLYFRNKMIYSSTNKFCDVGQLKRSWSKILPNLPLGLYQCWSIFWIIPFSLRRSVFLAVFVPRLNIPLTCFTDFHCWKLFNSWVFLE